MNSDYSTLFPVFALIVISVLILKFHRRGKTNIANRAIKDTLKNVTALYSSNRCSGRSLKSTKTKLGGAHNCLKVVITDDTLFVTAPFSIFAALSEEYDLEHTIPKTSVREYNKLTRLFRLGYRLSYADVHGIPRTIELWPKNWREFEQALEKGLSATA
jgi:hypothetical protein